MDSDWTGTDLQLSWDSEAFVESSEARSPQKKLKPVLVCVWAKLPSLNRLHTTISFVLHFRLEPACTGALAYFISIRFKKVTPTLYSYKVLVSWGSASEYSTCFTYNKKDTQSESHAKA